MRVQLAFAVLLNTAICIIICEAGLQPVFNIEEVTWRATHVLLVTEGDRIDGTVQVLDAWKGEIDTGQWISIPQLAAYASEESRLSTRPYRIRYQT